MYIVAATGGYEKPVFAAYDNKIEAVNAFNECLESVVSQPGERVDLLKIEELYVTTLDSFAWDGE